MRKVPLSSHLPSITKKSLTSDWKKISKYLDLVFEDHCEKIRLGDLTQIIYHYCSFNRSNDIIPKIQGKFDSYFKDYLSTSLSPYDKQSSDVDDLAKEYILKTGGIMPRFETVVSAISSIFRHVQLFRGNYSFHDKFHSEFIRMLEECNCYDYIFFSISKLFDIFLNQYQINTYFQESLFQSVHSTKDLISYASPGKLRILKEMLLQQTQTYFTSFVTDSYQQLIPPPSLSDSSDDEGIESKTSIFSGASHTIADNDKAFDPIPHIVSYCDEAQRLVELDYQMTCTLFDQNLANDIKNEAIFIISDPETDTIKFCLSQTYLILKNRKYDEFEKLYNMINKNPDCIELLFKYICEQISKEPKNFEQLQQVIEFYTKIDQNLFLSKREYIKYSEKMRKCLTQLVNSDSEGVLKGLLKTINIAALTDSDIKSILPIISLFQMKSEFELMHLRQVARRLTLNRIDQIDNETEIFTQLETVKPPLQLDTLRALINDAAKSLQNNQYGPVLLLNATSWPYKPPYPSPILLSDITVKINDAYIKNNPNRELHFPINYWVVKVKDTLSGTIYDGTGVQAEILLYFNNHKVITSTSLEPRISESFLSAALKAMSCKAVPALTVKDDAYSLNKDWSHDKIVKLKHPSYKDEVQVAKNAEKSKGDMIEACAVKRMKMAKILRFNELDEYIKSELASKVPVSTDEIRKHIDLLINRGYIEEMGSGRLAYIS